MKNKIFILLSLCVFAFTSCSDWLDVKPKTNVEEEELFKREQGFKEALTGVYIKMADVSGYGRELTYGFMDVLAQRYSVDASNAQDYTLKEWYEFPSKKTESYTNAFWSNHYNMIANLNNLLANIDKGRDVLITPGYYEIIKGEALGLRSFLYFDLLRMFGPIYKNSPADKAIPYRTAFNRDVAKLLPAKDLVDSLIVSLKEAEELLENDPMIISFPSGAFASDGDPFLRSRFKRMNKFAVKAQLARVYMYKQDKVNAMNYANEVIDGNRFSLVTDNSGNRICSTEIIFSLSMDEANFSTRIDNDFVTGMSALYYIRDRDRVYELFNTSEDGNNDMRMKEGQGFSITVNGSYTLKFSQKQLYTKEIENTVPLIRLPEMYYILAECTDDLTESARVLSKVRESRGLENQLPFTNEDTKRVAIEKEYRKEFYGEGQLWYFYKRHAYTTFQFCPINNMVEKNYRFSLPDDEVSLGDVN